MRFTRFRVWGLLGSMDAQTNPNREHLACAGKARLPTYSPKYPVMKTSVDTSLIKLAPRLVIVLESSRKLLTSSLNPKALKIRPRPPWSVLVWHAGKGLLTSSSNPKTLNAKPWPPWGVLAFGASLRCSQNVRVYIYICMYACR